MITRIRFSGDSPRRLHGDVLRKRRARATIHLSDFAVRHFEALATLGSERERDKAGDDDSRRARRVQPAFAGAGHVQPDSVAAQPQRLAHAQAVPPASRVGAAIPWQPQAQVLPGQLAHWQREANWGFMACPFGGWRTRRVRGNEFWRGATPKA